MGLNISLYFIRILIGGLVCFLSILVMSKTRNSEWMFIVSACLFNYFFEVLTLLIELGLIPLGNSIIISFIHFIIPSCMLIIAFIIKLLKRRG